jgi:hypothetical protein
MKRMKFRQFVNLFLIDLDFFLATLHSIGGECFVVRVRTPIAD